MTGLLRTQKSPCHTSPCTGSRLQLASSSRHWCAITERHKITLQNVFIHRSWLVDWTSHLHPECWIPDNFQATPENSSLPSSLDFILKKKKIKPSLPFLNFALFSLNSQRLARICSEQCLEICITSTPFVCLPLYNVLLIVFLNCKSLWIKASANDKCKCSFSIISLTECLEAILEWWQFGKQTFTYFVWSWRSCTKCWYKFLHVFVTLLIFSGNISLDNETKPQCPLLRWRASMVTPMFISAIPKHNTWKASLALT